MAKTADLIQETIKVDQAGNWGPRVGETWYGINEPLEAKDFVQGQTYNVLVKVGKPTPKSPHGKRYITQIVGQESHPKDGPAVTTPAAMTGGTQSTSSPKQAPVNTYGSVTDEKSIRILRQGVFQAVLQTPSLAGTDMTPDQLVAFVKDVSEKIILAIIA